MHNFYIVPTQIPSQHCQAKHYKLIKRTESQTRKAVLPNMTPLPGHQTYLWPRVTLTFDLLTPKVDSFMPCTMATCANLHQKVVHFKIPFSQIRSGCVICERQSYARFYELGLTRDSRFIPGLTVVSVLSTSNLGLNWD